LPRSRRRGIRGKGPKPSTRAGYPFAPDDRASVEGIVPYGDTSLSVDYARRLAAPLELIALEWASVDKLQLVLVFEKR
jgi:hypothetical protein